MSHWENSGKSDEWYTPKYIFDALGVVFDTDVASPAGGPLHTPCLEFIHEESLEKEWSGFVWMNPPFGGRNGLEPWLNKFFIHGNGIALTPDRTSAPWFRSAWSSADLVMFLPKVRFINEMGVEGKSPSSGTALMAKGEVGVQALKSAYKNGLGILAVPTHYGEV